MKSIYFLIRQKNILKDVKFALYSENKNIKFYLSSINLFLNYYEKTYIVGFIIWFIIVNFFKKLNSIKLVLIVENLNSSKIQTF